MKKLWFTSRSSNLLWLCIVLGVSGSVGRADASAANAPHRGWWQDAVFYELFVRSFADAATGPLAGDGIGDLQGAIDHLDYLNDGRGRSGSSLGINAVWLMPINPSPSYHGYDVTDYFAVNPDFGDIALMKRFVQEAHRRGIRVIIDLVLNHCSAQHPLFKGAAAAAPGSPVRRLFRFADLPEQLVGPWDQRAWHPLNGGFYYGVFSAEMPDWNLNEPAVTEHHRRAAAFWLKDVGIDGFRLDAVRYLVEVGEELQDTAATRQWLKEFTDYCHTVKPDSFVVAEDTAHMAEVARCIRGGSVDSSFEFDLARATIESVRLRTPGILQQALRRLRELYGEESPWSTFLTNHDQERTRTQLDGSWSLTRLATKLLFTLPGVTFLYYGEELGMQAGKPDPELRTPLPWTSEPPNAGFTTPQARAWMRPKADYPEINIATEAGDPNSMLALYHRLIRLRAESPALQRGVSIPVVASDRRAYAEMRETNDDVVLVLANFGAKPLPGPTLTARQSMARQTWTMTEELESATVVPPALDEAGGFQQWRPLSELAPESVYIFQWRR